MLFAKKLFANLLSVESKLMHVTAWSPCAWENSNTERPVSKSQTLTTWGEKTRIKGHGLKDWFRELQHEAGLVFGLAIQAGKAAEIPALISQIKIFLAAGLHTS